MTLCISVLLALPVFLLLISRVCRPPPSTIPLIGKPPPCSPWCWSPSPSSWHLCSRAPPLTESTHRSPGSSAASYLAPTFLLLKRPNSSPLVPPVSQARLTKSRPPPPPPPPWPWAPWLSPTSMRTPLTLCEPWLGSSQVSNGLQTQRVSPRDFRRGLLEGFRQDVQEAFPEASASLPST